jgi:hypothetical protein
VPTRKQRRRRDKDFRHDVRVFEVDDEGNEIPLAERRVREEKPKPAKSAAKPAQRGRGRAAREVPPPSWERSLKRGGTMGALLFVLMLFLLKSGPMVERIAVGIFYAVMLVPVTYLADRTAYRSYLKRTGRAAGKTN